MSRLEAILHMLYSLLKILVVPLLIIFVVTALFYRMLGGFPGLFGGIAISGLIVSLYMMLVEE